MENPIPDKAGRLRFQNIRYSPHSVNPGNFNSIRDDYLTGRFTITELVEKYGVAEQSLVYYCRKFWKPILIKRGITPPIEPKRQIIRKSKEFWRDVEIEYRHGVPEHELSRKFNVHADTIRKKKCREGWTVGRYALPGFGAGAAAKPAEIGLEMRNFTEVVRQHIDRILIGLKDFGQRKRKWLTVEHMERIAGALALCAKSFASIVDTGLRLYKLNEVSAAAEEFVINQSAKAHGLEAINRGMSKIIRPNQLAKPIRVIKPSSGDDVDARAADG